MHNKMLSLLKKIVCFAIFLLINYTAISQSYLGFKIKDVILIKGNNYQEINPRLIVYETPSEIKYYSNVSQDSKTNVETFSYDADNNVIRWARTGSVHEDVVMKLISENNQQYKRVDVGEKQGFFQWIDAQKRYNITMNTMKIDKGIDSYEDYYFFLIEAIKQ